MAISSWLCTSSTKSMLVKIVHPGGHVELHDRPLLAAEIMLRNPRCCVAHPNVFQQPWAIVAPDTTLMLGQKFYVVPISTIRKLQRLSFKRSPSPVQEISTNSQSSKDNTEDDDQVYTCWLFRKNKNTPRPCYDCLKHSGKTPSQSEKDINCFVCLLSSIKIKSNGEDNKSNEAKSSSSMGSSETKELTGKTRKEFTTRKGPRGSPNSHTSLEYWQPSLQSINEEKSTE